MSQNPVSGAKLLVYLTLIYELFNYLSSPLILTTDGNLIVEGDDEICICVHNHVENFLVADCTAFKRTVDAASASY